MRAAEELEGVIGCARAATTFTDLKDLAVMLHGHRGKERGIATRRVAVSTATINVEVQLT